MPSAVGQRRYDVFDGRRSRTVVAVYLQIPPRPAGVLARSKSALPRTRSVRVLLVVARVHHPPLLLLSHSLAGLVCGCCV